MAATDPASKQELVEAKQSLNARITKLVATVAAISAVLAGLGAWQGNVNSQLGALEDRVAALEAPAPTPAPEPEPQPEPQPTGALLFSSDFKSWDGWYLQCLPGRATLVNGWARFEVRPGDADPDTGKSRCEVSGPDFREGEDLWVRDIFRRSIDDTSTPNDWLLTQQLHEDNWSGSPANGVLYGKDWTGRLGNQITYAALPALVKGQTNELLYRIKLSQGADGEVEAFWNGATLPVYKGKTLFAPSAYLKAGIYRASASTGTSVIEHKLIEVGTTRAIVGG